MKCYKNPLKRLLYGCRNVFVVRNDMHVGIASSIGTWSRVDECFTGVMFRDVETTS